MNYLLYSYERGKYLSSFHIKIVRGAMVLDNRYTEHKHKALYFLTANEAVYLASLIACYEEQLYTMTENDEP